MPPFSLTVRHLARRLTSLFRAFVESITILSIRWIAHCSTAFRPGIIYHPLDNTKLRVLTVLPPLTTRRDEPIRCVLEHVSLEDFTEEYKDWQRKTGHDWKSQPHTTRLAWIEHKTTTHSTSLEAIDNSACRYNWGDYVALSYCWGCADDASARHIILNGRYTKVTENLESALHLARVADSLTRLSIGCTKLWIDALCIQQSNDEEKKHEIRRMKNIYGGSMGVFVHLGPFRNDDSSHGIDVLQDIAKEVERCLVRNEYPALEQRVDLNNDANEKDYKALCKLLANPYWRRLWILQELAMSDETSVIGYGDRKMLFKEVVLTSKFVWHNLERVFVMLGSQIPDYIALDGCMWVILFIEQLQEVSRCLENLGSVRYQNLEVALNLSQSGLATLSHDKAFGLLALLPDAIGAKMEMYYDYKLSKEEVFVAFSKAIMQTTGDLDVITLKSRRQTMKPSWATDWEFPPDRVNLLHNWHTYGYKNFAQSYTTLHKMIHTARHSRADASLKSVFTFSPDSTILSCSTIFIGAIDGIAIGMPNVPTVETGEEAHEFLGGAPIQPQHQTNNPYGDAPATLRALTHTLFANPIWGDSEPASLFRIPWLYKKPYTSFLVSDFQPGHESIWKEKALAMNNQGWDFLFSYCNYYSFEMFRRLLGPFLVAGKPFYEYFEEEVRECGIPHDRVYLDLAKVVGAHLGRTLVTLESGHFGLVPNNVARGDLICVILGCSMPVALRHIEGTPHYEVIGECYIEGFARGEAAEGLGDGRYRIEDITLC